MEGAGNDNKDQYLSNCNRPLYLAGVINAFVAIIPLPLHVHIMKEMLDAVRCLKSSEDMILALAGQFKQLSHEPEKFR